MLARLSAVVLVMALALPATSVAVTNQRIVYISASDVLNVNDVRIIQPSGEGDRMLIESPPNMFAPTLSPDGRHVAFTRFEGSTSNDVYIARSDGSNVEPLVQLSNGQGEPSFSPDGKRIAYTDRMSGDDEIWTVKLDGTNSQRLTTHDQEDLEPVWSPNGKKIAFISNRTGDFDVYTMDSDDGGHVKNITDKAGVDQDPEWTEDGKSLIYSHYVLDEAQTDLFSIDADGSGRGRITKTLTKSERSPSLSPSGNRIVFQGDGRIFASDLDGGDRTSVTKGNAPTAQEPDWGFVR